MLYIHKDRGKKDPPFYPAMYLEADISNFVIPNNWNGVTCWDMSAYSHVNKSLQGVELKLKEDNVRWKPLKKTVDLPLSRQSYHPELGMTE